MVVLRVWSWRRWAMVERAAGGNSGWGLGAALHSNSGANSTQRAGETGARGGVSDFG